MIFNRELDNGRGKARTDEEQVMEGLDGLN